MARTLAILGSLLLLVPSCGALAATLSVNTVDDVVAQDGKCSLREAISAVNHHAASGALAGECVAGDGNGDTIVLPAGTYTLSIAGVDEDNNVGGDLDIRTKMQIQGAGMGSTIIDGNGIDRVFDVLFGGVTVGLSDLSIVNGRAPATASSNSETGGGINNAAGANLVLTRVEFADNVSGAGASGATFAFSGGDGGAIYTSGGRLTLVACSLHRNVTGVGGDDGSVAVGAPGASGQGGAIASSGSVVAIESTLFSANHTGAPGTGGAAGVGSAGSGGAIYANNGSVIVLLSAFDGNLTGPGNSSTGGSGGAIFASGATLDMVQSSVTHNGAGMGGGIAAVTNTLALRNVTVSGNTALSTGGGLYVLGASPRLDFVTLSANQALGHGGGVHLDGGIGGSTLTFRNSILSGNTAPSARDCETGSGTNTLSTLGNNLSGQGCPAALANGDVPTTNPQLAPLGDNGGMGLTQIPAVRSPAVDGGSCVGSGDGVDQRGHARFLDVPRRPNAIDACDIGAVELDDDIFWDGFD